MYHIRDNAEQSVRNLLRNVAKERGKQLSARDYLDDGSPVSIRKFGGWQLDSPDFRNQIQVQVSINEEEGSAVIDFEGTGPELRGNLNAPIAVVHSAVIYCMRAMLDVDIPLNAGCLVPIESESKLIPETSITLT